MPDSELLYDVLRVPKKRQENLKTMMKFLNSTGKRVKLLREDLHMTQTEVIEALRQKGKSISQASLSRLESDNSDEGQLIAALADLYNVTTDYLLMRTESTLTLEEETEEREKILKERSIGYDLDPKMKRLAQKLIAAFTQLSSRDQLLLLNMVETMRQAETPHIIGEDHDPK
jgi:transcriptional regulator with XRE-family HTH domain